MRSRAGARTRWKCVKIVGVSAAVSLLLSQANSVFAQTSDAPGDSSQTTYGWRETWAGVDATRDQWLAYSGITVAPWSRDIYSDGWRVRMSGGYGQYGYDGWSSRSDCGEATENDACNEKSRERRRYTVQRAYAEILIGYYLQLGALTAKAFAGASMSSFRHTVDAPADDQDGTDYGAKGALELWLNIGDRAWTSLDLSYASVRDETSSRWRTGWRVAPHLSIGPEIRFDKNIETGSGLWDGRGGLFARYDWTGGEVSLAGGVSSRIDDWDAADISPYGTLNVLFQF